ncbi:MAG: NIPSNAP family protein [Acidobacteriota bacterium]|nr:NIPSNAP family protein [Acidobacteriota bacterium]
MMRALLPLLVGLGLASAAAAQRPPPAPCGPKADLSAELSNNVAGDSRCFEIRMYTVDKSRVGTGDFVGDIDMLHQRFREQEVAIFEKHGAEILGVFQSLDNSDTLVWMLAYRNRAHRQEVWKGFLEDPAWKALLAKYNTPITAEVFMLSASDYSALK